MAFYNRVKTMKNAPIGSIMPWGGNSTLRGSNPPNVPHGWILCDGNTHPAENYPLLASMIGNTYGPSDTAIKGQFPDYEASDTFRVPDLNGRAMVDVERSMLLETKYQYGQPDANNVVGSLIEGDGTAVTPPAIYSADTDITFNMAVLNNMAGRITEFTLNDPTWSKTYYVIGRKLGIDHTPAHRHPGQYTTAQTEGKYVQVFETSAYQVSGSPDYESANLTGSGATGDSPDRWANGTGSVTYYDENTLPVTDQTLTFDPATKTLVPETGLVRTIPQGGGNTPEFSDTYNYGHAMVGHTGVFPPPTNIMGRVNYLNGDQTTTYPTNISHSGEDFTEGTLAPHNHFSFDISMTGAGLRPPSNIAINNVQSYTVNVTNIDSALNIVMDNNTPSQTVIMIIRAF